MIRHQISTVFGKTVRSALRVRGGGSAMPGLVIEKIDPDFVRRTLDSLPHGVVLISGTNGKTTTTKMIVELLESQGMKVFTNRTGSNFVRGVAAALLGSVNIKGQLDADIAVLELDEAHAVHFVKVITPRISLFLNVMRDQLDRFGEIDTTAKLLQTVAGATSDTVILNREDPRISELKNHTSAEVHYFGLDESLINEFPSDDQMRSSSSTNQAGSSAADVILNSVKDSTATFLIDGKETSTKLALQGIYNIFNAAAALATARTILDESIDSRSLVEALSKITPAFGRGEQIIVSGQPIDIILVKNPSGFRLSLRSFEPSNEAKMIIVNDNYADGRDMSWLWDVEFESLKETGVAMVSGIRAYDMALRLQYDEVEFRQVEPKINLALKKFIQNTSDQPKRIYCTYTAMLAVRRELSKLTDVKVVS